MSCSELRYLARKQAPRNEGIGRGYAGNKVLEILPGVVKGQ